MFEAGTVLRKIGSQGCVFCEYLFQRADLTWLRRDHLGDAVVARDIAGDADVLILVLRLRRPEFGSVFAPNQNRKYLVGIRLTRSKNVGCPLLRDA